MVSRGRWVAVVAIVACLALGAVALALRGSSSASRPLSLYPYPPNARQLIAAGLTGRPASSASSGPIVVDMVLVDGLRTTVLYHATTSDMSSMPFLTLRDDLGRLYQPQSGASVGGVGFGMGPRSGGWQAFIWGVMRLVPFLTSREPMRGYTAFASLPPTAHAAVVSIGLAGRTRVVRVPLHLSALSSATATTVFNRRVTWRGVVVTLLRVTRAMGIAQFRYAIDVPLSRGQRVPGQMPYAEGDLSDARGRPLVMTDLSGSCGGPMGASTTMHCDDTASVTPPAVGTLLRLTITVRSASGFRILPNSGAVVSFRMP